MKQQQQKEKEITKEQLNRAGLKATPARLLILSIFSEKCQPLSAEDIYKKLKKNDIDLVTVYRTLTSFEEAGILQKVDLHKDAQCYELAKHHHHHIICNSCGLIEELDGCTIEKSIARVASKSDAFKLIQSHSLEFFGLCTLCAKA